MAGGGAVRWWLLRGTSAGGCETSSVKQNEIEARFGGAGGASQVSYSGIGYAGAVSSEGKREVVRGEHVSDKLLRSRCISSVDRRSTTNKKIKDSLIFIYLSIDARRKVKPA